MQDDPAARAAELAGAWLGSLRERPVGIPVGPAELRARLGGPLGEAGQEPVSLINELAAALEPGLVATAGPRYFGFVTGGSLPAALAADWLVSAFDQNAAMYVMSPAAAVVEEITAAWLLDLLGLPPQAAVGFVTGAQMANFSCLAAARNALLAELLNDVVLNQVLFRVPGAKTAAVIERVQRDGTCWLGGTSWGGEPAIRFSVSNWSTTEDDIHQSVAAIRAAINAARTS